MRKIYFTIMILSFSLHLYSSDCQEKSIYYYWQNSDLIFEGTVIAKYDYKIFGYGSKLTYTNLKIEKIYKGSEMEINDTISILNKISTADLNFEENGTYLIFTNYNRFLTASKCSGSTQIQESDYRIKVDSIQYYNSNEIKNSKNEKVILIDSNQNIENKGIWPFTVMIISIILNLILIILVIKKDK